MKTKPLTPAQWKAAVELLHMELGRTHTLMAQLFNWPGSPEHTAAIPQMIDSNRMIMETVMKRVNKERIAS